jgi:predicted nucleic acid-binding protein
LSFLIDTNIISEVRKGARCDERVAAWYASIDDNDLYLSVLVLGEIRRGIEQVRPKDRARADALEQWLMRVVQSFATRIIPVDQEIADEWGRTSATRPHKTVDKLLAATAKVHRLTLVTRNIADVTGLGAAVLNPFEWTA